MKHPKLPLQKLTQITTLHLIRLICRSVLFLAALVFYILRQLEILSTLFGQIAMLVISGIFLAEMTCRFFPSRLESMGCQKQFARNYLPKQAADEALPHERRKAVWQVLLVALFWVLLNSAIAALFFVGVLDTGIMMLICLAYSVCDMICILFFCPFQSWLMKNRCCGTCRIYNWDYAMMFTPLLFVGNLIGYVLCGAALALLIRWEITYARHPERFFETTNACLDCKNCKEKLCRHKKSIRTFLERQKERLTAFHSH